MEDGADQDCAAQPQRPIERQPIVGNGLTRGQANDSRVRPARSVKTFSAADARPSTAFASVRKRRPAHDPAPNPIEQLRRVTRLERSDCGARRRLGQIEMSRALCDVPEFSHGGKMRSCSRVTTPIRTADTQHEAQWQRTEGSIRGNGGCNRLFVEGLPWIARMGKPKRANYFKARDHDSLNARSLAEEPRPHRRGCPRYGTMR